MKQVSIFLSIVATLLLCSCSAVPKNWKTTVYGEDNTQAVSVTHNYSLKWVDKAIIEVLDQMEIMVIEDTFSSDGKSIKAATLDQDITIELKSLTLSSTRMKIDIKLTDREDHASIGDEIMIKTKNYLRGNPPITTISFSEGEAISKKNLSAK